MYTKKSILDELAKLGIDPKCTLMIHMSYKSLGNLEGGPDTFISALMEYMEKGLLVIPAHTWDNISVDKETVMDTLNTNTCIGIVPELFRKYNGVFRSWHPTHSVCAYGKDAEDFIKGEELMTTPCGFNSVYHKLLERRAIILMIGVDYTKNTFIHGVEEWNNVPNRLSRKQHDLYVLTPNGERYYTPQYRHISNVSKSYNKLEAIMEKYGAMYRGTLCDANVSVSDAEQLYLVLSRLLESNVNLLSDCKPIEV